MGDALALARAALALDGAAFATLEAHAHGLRLALWVLAAAGLSSTLGQSVVLFANRVPPGRFAASLLLSTALFVVTTLLWATSLSLVAEHLFDRSRPLATAVRTVGLAHAPQLFGVVALLPYFGTGVSVLLSVWTFLAIGVGGTVTFDLPLPAALAGAMLGWLALQLLQRTVGRPLVALTRRLRGWTAGRPLRPLHDVHRHDPEEPR